MKQHFREYSLALLIILLIAGGVDTERKSLPIMKR